MMLLSTTFRNMNINWSSCEMGRNVICPHTDSIEVYDRQFQDPLLCLKLIDDGMYCMHGEENRNRIDISTF